MFWHDAESNQKCFVFGQQFTNIIGMRTISCTHTADWTSNTIRINCTTFSHSVSTRAGTTHSRWIRMYQCFHDGEWLFVFFRSLSLDLFSAAMRRICIRRTWKKNKFTNSIDWYKRAEQDRRPENNAQMNIWNDTIRWYDPSAMAMVRSSNAQCGILIFLEFFTFSADARSHQTTATTTTTTTTQEQPKYRNRNSLALPVDSGSHSDWENTQWISRNEKEQKKDAEPSVREKKKTCMRTLGLSSQ